MTKKNRKTMTMSIDGKPFKHIVKINKEGKEEWTKFIPLSDGVEKGAHYIHEAPEKNHNDLYYKKKDTKIDYDTGNIKPAGVVLYPGKETRIAKVPQIEVSKEEWDKLSPEERAEEYVKRVRVINGDK